MAYPRRLLADGVQVELDLHPHARVLVGPVLSLLVVVPVAAFLAARVPPGPLQAPARVVVAVLALGALATVAVRPFLRWVTTRYVVTDRRLITRHGVLTRSGRDLPLSRVTDISSTRGLLQRLLGCGTLVVETARPREPLMLLDVPRVQQVQRLLHELAEDFEPTQPVDDEFDDDFDDGFHDGVRHGLGRQRSGGSVAS
jgi:membrane protein YdbS with pleckstrin-like domain